MTQTLLQRAAPSGWALAVLCCSLLFGCSAVRTARVVDVRDAPASDCLWRPEGEAPPPLFVHTAGALAAKRQLKLAISVEPPLELYIQSTLEEELGVEIEELRLEFVGYRYAYYFPSRQDDFVLRVELEAPAAGLQGEFEGVIGGDELQRSHVLLGSDWDSDVPNTGPEQGTAEFDEQEARVERVADGRAFEHRLLLQLVTRRLAREVAGR